MRTRFGDIRWFVYSNVMVYSRDLRDPTKQALAAAWLRAVVENGELILSPQIVDETCSVLLRRESDRRRHSDVRDFARGLLKWCKAPLDAEVVNQALVLHERHHLPWYDCPMLASALEVNADYLLTEDLQDGRRFGRLQIVNPFRIAPEDFLAAMA